MDHPRRPCERSGSTLTCIWKVFKRATDDCEAIWQTTWPRLPPRVLEAVATVEWGEFLMRWPRT
eukprot:12131300-Karenia_brevis.AAC.1